MRRHTCFSVLLCLWFFKLQAIQTLETHWYSGSPEGQVLGTGAQIRGNCASRAPGADAAKGGCDQRSFISNEELPGPKGLVPTQYPIETTHSSRNKHHNVYIYMMVKMPRQLLKSQSPYFY